MTAPTLDEQLRTLVDTVPPVVIDDLPRRIVVHRRSARRTKVAALVTAIAVVALGVLGALLLREQTASPPAGVTTPTPPITLPADPDACHEPGGDPSSRVRTPECAAPLVGFAPLLPAHVPDGWVLGDRGTVLGVPATTAPGSTTEPTPVYLTVLGPRDSIEHLPDGSFGIVEGGRGVRLLQRRITPTMLDGCASGAISAAPMPLVLANGMEGCVGDAIPSAADAPETRAYVLRRDGIQVVVLATSVDDAEVREIVESLR